MERKDMERNEQETQELERKLRTALAHRKAPLGLKARVLAQARERRQGQRRRWWMVQRVAATVVLAAAVGGFMEYRHIEEVRKGEAAKEQVLTALRIAGRTMGRVQERLSDDR